MACRSSKRETGGRVSTVLQLRVHPQLIALRERLLADRSRRHSVRLTYITARGGWYDVSWKGHEDRSGGVVTNIGIHFFDLLLWLFGPVRASQVHLREAQCAAGVLDLERADVQWFLSTDLRDLPFTPQPGTKTTFRSITVDGDEVEFSEGFADLHTRVYEEVLAGRGFGIADARPSVELAAQIRQSARHGLPSADAHPQGVEPWLTSSSTNRLTWTTGARSAPAPRSGISPT